MITLVLGGVRSGKTAFAQALAEKSNKRCFYLATATADDEQMQQRIQTHQQQRDNQRWQTLEEPLDLAALLRQYSGQEDCLLIDCLTLWQTNIMMGENGLEDMPLYTDALLQSLQQSRADIILVSNEINLGGIAMDPLTRQFCDAAGQLHQQIAAISHQVFLVTAGLPLRLKPNALSV